MNRATTLALVLSFALLFASCVQPVRISTRDEEFLARGAGRKPWRKVAVLPFNGPPEFRRPAAEWLAFRVRGLGLFEVTDPSLAEIELKRNGLAIGEADVTVDDARRAGLALGVDEIPLARDFSRLGAVGLHRKRRTPARRRPIVANARPNPASKAAAPPWDGWRT